MGHNRKRRLIWLSSALLLASACDDGNTPPERPSASGGESEDGEGDDCCHPPLDPAPGCNPWADNEPIAAVIAPGSIRISSVSSIGNPCEESQEVEEADDCTYDDFVYLLTLPSLEPGEYDFAQGQAQLVLQSFWEHDQSEEGCFCELAPSLVNIPITSGRLLITEFSGSYSAGLNFSNMPELANVLSGGFPVLAVCDGA